MRKRLGLRRFAGLTTVAVAVALAVTGIALGVTGAISTTDNPGYFGPGTYENQACLNGTGVNCNIYVDKKDVWFSGLPVSAALGSGTYFFAVLSPGGQPAPNDGGTNVSNGELANLSDNADAYTNRTFTVDGSGNITNYTGDHQRDGNLLQLFPYADTPNPGGVYILAVCSLSAGYPVAPRDCKYDAFKVKAGNTTTPPAAGASVTKDAAGAYKTTWTWDASKTVDKTKVSALNGNATFTYTVTVTHNGGTNSDVNVSGTISVTNPNVDANNDVVPMDINSLTDSVSDGTTTTNCTVTGAPSGGGTVTLTAFSTDFAYSCNLGNTLPTTPVSNTVTVGWGAQDLNLTGDPNSSTLSHLDAGSDNFTFSNILFTQTKIDDSVTVTDTFGLHGTTGTTETLGTVSSTDPSPTTLQYSRIIAIPPTGCLTYDNTANFTTNTSQSTDGTLGDNSQSVQVCRVPPNTGALTMGFWQNKNGQGIITSGGAISGVCKSGTWLRQYAPFQDLSATASCSAVATYVYNIIKAANASGAAMNAMLKAQMLATALNVYFSDPALGTNKINAPAPIGGINIDLTQICKMIDGSGGTATCSGIYQNASSAFGGATSLTVSQILAYAASQSNGGGSVWYGQVKATQELAKNTFDAINNKVAFQAP